MGAAVIIHEGRKGKWPIKAWLSFHQYLVELSRLQAYLELKTTTTTIYLLIYKLLSVRDLIPEPKPLKAIMKGIRGISYYRTPRALPARRC